MKCFNCPDTSNFSKNVYVCTALLVCKFESPKNFINLTHKKPTGEFQAIYGHYQQIFKIKVGSDSWHIWANCNVLDKRLFSKFCPFFLKCLCTALFVCKFESTVNFINLTGEFQVIDGHYKQIFNVKLESGSWNKWDNSTVLDNRQFSKF